MNYLIYNGIDTRDLGVLVQTMPEEKRAARQIITAAPLGHDGAIITDLGAYDTYSSAFTLNCFGACSPADLFRTYSGEGWLTTSDRPTRRRYVYFYESQSTTRLRTSKCYDSVSIPFTAEPFEYEKTPSVVQAENGGLITGQGDVDARPIIKITGTGSVTLMTGGNTLIIDGLTATKPLYIDSETKFAYVMNGDDMQSAYAAGVTATMQTGEAERWPVLNHSGSTAVSWTGTAAVEITPCWRWF